MARRPPIRRPVLPVYSLVGMADRVYRGDERGRMVPRAWFDHASHLRRLERVVHWARAFNVTGPEYGEYLQSSEFPGFDYGDVHAAYVAGARSGRTHQPTDQQIECAADAYVKAVAPKRADTGTLLVALSSGSNDSKETE